MARRILTCSHCSSRFDVSKFPLGSKVKCGRCEQVLVVPTDSSPSEPPPSSAGAARDSVASVVAPGPPAAARDGARDRRFADEGEAREYVEERLRRAAPEGWRVVPGDGSRSSLEWRLLPSEDESGPLRREFGVWMTHGLDCVIVSHGNDDAGPAPLGAMARMRATVVDCRALHVMDLAKLLAPVFRDEEPNTWGHS